VYCCHSLVSIEMGPLWHFEIDLALAHELMLMRTARWNWSSKGREMAIYRTRQSLGPLCPLTTLAICPIQVMYRRWSSSTSTSLTFDSPFLKYRLTRHTQCINSTLYRQLYSSFTRPPTLGTRVYTIQLRQGQTGQNDLNINSHRNCVT